MRLRSVFSLVLAASMGVAQNSPQGDRAVITDPAFDWAWSVFLPKVELGSSDWRAWVAENQPRTLAGRKRNRGIPGATVEVVDRFLDIHRERVLEFNAIMAPVMQRAFRVGEGSSYTSQMLSEFMSMHGANFRPPSIPSVWYNGLIPYWVQQGWNSPMGPGVTLGVEARPSRR